MERDRLVQYLNELLQIESISESSLNGLQLEGAEQIDRLALAVDAAAVTIDAAVAGHCQMLFVHHGLFWGQPLPLIGATGARVRACFAAGLSIYAAHLPLDCHPTLGNNVLLAQALGAQPVSRFGIYEGVTLGLLAELTEPCTLAELAGRLAASGCNAPLCWDFGVERQTKLAVVTGSGCGLLTDAIAVGADCFVSGEPRHSAFHLASEAGINCLFGGHYRTATAGVLAVGERVALDFGIETLRIEQPTGV